MSVSEYELQVAGIPHTFQLSAEDAKRLGAKAVTPSNKSVTPANKAGKAENK